MWLEMHPAALRLVESASRQPEQKPQFLRWPGMGSSGQRDHHATAVLLPLGERLEVEAGHLSSSEVRACAS